MGKIISSPAVRIQGGKHLDGTIVLQGDKTVAIHSLLAALFCPDTKFKFRRFPLCDDAQKLVNWIDFNNLADIYIEDDALYITTLRLPNIRDIRKINFLRSSICILIPLSILNQKIIFSKIGGCNFTERPVNRHLDLAKKFGVEVIEEGDHFETHRSSNRRKVSFDCSANGVPSVGVTCHALISALVFKGEIHLSNVSIDPSVITMVSIISTKFIVNFDEINRTISIDTLYTKEPKETTINIPPDYTVAMTYISAALFNGGKLSIAGEIIFPESFIKLFKDLSIVLTYNDNKTNFSSIKLTCPKVINCSVAPGIPTDCGPILTAFLCSLNGKSKIIDNDYTDRNSHIGQLQKMGYCVSFDLNVTDIIGQKPNHDKVVVFAGDIRAGAACIVAALNREGTTTILNFNEVNRGYSSMIDNFKVLGASIELV